LEGWSRYLSSATCCSVNAVDPLLLSIILSSAVVKRGHPVKLALTIENSTWSPIGDITLLVRTATDNLDDVDLKPYLAWTLLVGFLYTLTKECPVVSTLFSTFTGFLTIFTCKQLTVPSRNISLLSADPAAHVSRGTSTQFYWEGLAISAPTVFLSGVTTISLTLEFDIKEAPGQKNLTVEAYVLTKDSAVRFVGSSKGQAILELV